MGPSPVSSITKCHVNVMCLSLLRSSFPPFPKPKKVTMLIHISLIFLIPIMILLILIKIGIETVIKSVSPAN